LRVESRERQLLPKSCPASLSHLLAEKRDVISRYFPSHLFITTTIMSSPSDSKTKDVLKQEGKHHSSLSASSCHGLRSVIIINPRLDVASDDDAHFS
jgi:hypothetical protein